MVLFLRKEIVHRWLWRQGGQTARNALDLPGGSDDKESAYSAGDLGLMLGLGRSPGGAHGNPLQYSGLENPWSEEPGGLQSMGLQRVEHDWVTKRSTAKRGPWLLVNKEMCLSLITTRSWILPISWMRLEVISALWYPKQRIWSCCAQIFDL